MLSTYGITDEMVVLGQRVTIKSVVYFVKIVVIYDGCPESNPRLRVAPLGAGRSPQLMSGIFL